MQRRDAVRLLGGLLVAPGFRMPPARQPGGLGIQLYTLRAEMREDFEGTLARVAEIGYREVEFAGYFERAPAEVRRILASAGLTAPAAHVPIEAVSGERIEATLADSAAVGHAALVVPSLPGELRSSLDGFRRAAALLGEAASRAAGTGIAIGYHNHDFEFAPIAGQVPFDVFAGALSDDVFLELDVFWAAKGGTDPVALMSRLGERVRMIHAKDMDATGEMVDPGAGTLDFDGILAVGRAHALEHVFVEHDRPASAFATARAGYAFLQPKMAG